MNELTPKDIYYLAGIISAIIAIIIYFIFKREK